MKVCSGTAKGVTLKCPRGVSVRPTCARVRQAIFSALSGKIGGSYVLDLYAGTGAMGIESLSREAARAVFVEISPSCLRIIKENLELAGLSDKATVLRGDALRVIRRLGRENRKFDVVIADPPYEAQKGAERKPSLAQKSLKALVESDILRANSLVILEHSGKGNCLKGEAGLRLLSVRKYGDTSVSTLCPS